MTSSSAETLSPSEFERLRQIIIKAADLLPSQGPITAYVFDNTLRALEDLPFHEALKRGGPLFGCEPYLSLARFQQEYERGRITDADLEAVVKEDLGETAQQNVLGLCTRSELRLAMLKFPLREAPAAELRWFIAESDALKKFLPYAAPNLREAPLDRTRRWILQDVLPHWSERKSRDGRPPAPSKFSLFDDVFNGFDVGQIERWPDHVWTEFCLQTLWRVSHQIASTVPLAPVVGLPKRPRDILLELTNEDSDVLVSSVLVRLCAAFTDQGLAEWVLPHREEGLFAAFIKIYGLSGGPPAEWLRGLDKELDRIAEQRLGPLDSILESLQLLGVTEDDWTDFISTTLLALRGWAGLLWQNEVRSDRVPIPVPAGTLIEFMAVRLILDRFALESIARRHGVAKEIWQHGAKPQVKPNHTEDRVEARTFLLFQVSQFMGWYPSVLFGLSAAQTSDLVTELETFSELERRRLFQIAFERNYRQRALNAFSVQTRQQAKRVEDVQFQAVFCIDAREESFRRHLEETNPRVETFAAPGFYCVPIYYRGVEDAHFSTLCPIVVRPQHWIIEEPLYSMTQVEGRRAATRKALGTAQHQVHVGSRSILKGALLSASIGVFASVPLVARVLFPRLTARIRRKAESLVKPLPVTRLRLERLDEKPSQTDSGFGFSLPEMINFGERVLRDIGLTQGFAPIVMFFGHGSACQNNPHKSAYDCGACTGMAGSPNARALAAMLNDPRVREALATRNIIIPATTYFLGGLHNTGDDTTTFYDLDLLPRAHRPMFEAAKDTLDQACERNAHERCRRFYSAPLNLTQSDALLHVEDRTEDLAQVRPEFGNSTNALCFVGRRSRVRGLFMDRRCFMHSYDPTTDDAEATILARILGPVVFVCAGINLQYMFSYIDSPGWGSGTKLPHNITSLLGVMDGAASDLRTGLPWQGVEIHEPVRLLFVIESTQENLEKIMNRNPVVGRLIRNEWVQLAILNPESNEILHYKNGKYEPYHPDVVDLPVVAKSSDWYHGCREHLGFATIRSS